MIALETLTGNDECLGIDEVLNGKTCCNKIHVAMARTGFNRVCNKRLYRMYMETGSLVPSPRGMGMRLEGNVGMFYP